MHDDFYQMYLEEMKAITPCTQEENTQLLNDAAAGNEGAKKRLIEGNLEAALTCAKAYDGKGVLLTDLVAEANMALTMAVTEFLTNPGDGDFEGFLTARMKSPRSRPERNWLPESTYCRPYPRRLPGSWGVRPRWKNWRIR